MLTKRRNVIGKAMRGLGIQGILIRLGCEVIFSTAANIMGKKILKVIESTATKRK